MKISEEFLKSITNENAIDLMQITSRNTIKSLREIYHQLEGDKCNLIIAVYGSLARYEMLPMSDMDVLLFADNEEIINKTKTIIKSLKFDYLDFPSNDFLNLDNLKQFALSNSPDGHVAKFHIVAGTTDSKTYKQLINVRNISNNPYLVLENLIFDFNYLNYRVRQKYSRLGENLKYSNGGTRDILYLDWAADFLTNGEVSEKSRLNELPQIKYSIPIICRYLKREDEENDLLSCVNFVNIVKNQALLLKSQKRYFDGTMSVATAKELLNNYTYKNIVNEYELIEVHNSARSMIYNYCKLMYNKFLSSLRERVDTSTECRRLVDIADIWGKKSLDRDNIIKKLLKNGRWSDIATVICQDEATPINIDYAVDIALKKPEYSHLLRIAIKHNNTSDKTLNKILRNNQIAGCEDIDKRYKKILNERLKENER